MPAPARFHTRTFGGVLGQTASRRPERQELHNSLELNISSCDFPSGRERRVPYHLRTVAAQSVTIAHIPIDHFLNGHANAVPTREAYRISSGLHFLFHLIFHPVQESFVLWQQATEFTGHGHKKAPRHLQDLHGRQEVVVLLGGVLAIFKIPADQLSSRAAAARLTWGQEHSSTSVHCWCRTSHSCSDSGNTAHTRTWQHITRHASVKIRSKPICMGVSCCKSPASKPANYAARSGSGEKHPFNLEANEFCAPRQNRLDQEVRRAGAGCLACRGSSPKSRLSFTP